MASLDVLDYQVALDAALARPDDAGRPLLPPGLRRQAVKEARRVVDALAFRFALLDERPLPEDLDYLRALEAVKPPPAAAAVLARRRGHYARVRRRRLTTTWTILGILALAVGGLMWLATSEEAVPLASLAENAAVDVTSSVNRTFEVTPEMTRLRLDGTILVGKDARGIIEVRLLDPEGKTAFLESYAARGNIYLRENVAPRAGTWTLLVDFNDAHGSVQLTVDGVRPTR